MQIKYEKDELIYTRITCKILYQITENLSEFMINFCTNVRFSFNINMASFISPP